MLAKNSALPQTSLSGKAFQQMNNDNLIIKRDKLMTRLYAGRYKKVVALIAPAGYGKTTVLKEWLSEGLGHNHVSGVVFDELDNDVHTFWRLVFESLMQTDTSWTPELEAISKDLESNDIITIFAELFEHIDKRPNHLYLILDDYHVINNHEIEKMMAFFITHSPDHLHFIIASRTIPNLPFASLRVKDQLLEINQRSLMFSVPECEAFFCKVKGIELSNQDVHRINNRSEGWAAALQLAGESLREIGGTSRIVIAMEYSREYTYRFFENEVLSDIEEELLEFLAKVSLFDQFNVSLCDYALEIENSAQLLEEIEKRQLFITSTIERHKWFRLHSLLADYLNDIISRKSPEEKTSLQQRAISWYNDNGYSHLAVPLLIELGDIDDAVSIVDEIFSSYREYDFLGIYRLISCFPHDFLVANPRLLCQQALVGTLLGRVGNALRLLTLAANGLKSKEKHSGQTRISDTQNLFRIARGLVFCDNKEYSEGTGLLTDALEDLAPDSFLKLIINSRLMHAYFSNGDLPSCLEAAEAIIENAWDQDAMITYCTSICEKAMIKFEQAKLDEAYALYKKANNFARKHHLPEDMRIMSNMGVWEVSHERMESSPEETLISYGEVFAGSDSGVRPWTCTVFVGLRLVRFLVEKDMTDLAIFCINHVRAKDSHGVLSAELYGDTNTGELCLWQAEGNREQIRKWVSSANQEYKEGKMSILRAFLLGKMLVYLASYDYAIEVLEWVNKEATQAGRLNLSILANIQIAISKSNIGKMTHALDNIVEALIYAQEGNYKRVFVDQKALCQKLLTQIKEDYSLRPKYYSGLGLSSTYLAEVLKAFQPQAEGAKTNGRQHHSLPGVIIPVYTSLTSKEKEVLHLLSEGMCAKDIAAEMTVSAATAKTHIRNIYRKLGVHNRREAVQLARSLTPLN